MAEPMEDVSESRSPTPSPAEDDDDEDYVHEGAATGRAPSTSLSTSLTTPLKSPPANEYDHKIVRQHNIFLWILIDAHFNLCSL